MRFLTVFDSKLTVYEALSRCAKVGRAIPSIQGGIVRFVRDEPKTIPVAMFGPRNIVKNSLSIQYVMPSEDTADSVCVQYFSEKLGKLPKLLALLTVQLLTKRPQRNCLVARIKSTPCGKPLIWR